MIRFTYWATGLALLVLLSPFILAGILLGFVWVGLRTGMGLSHDSIDSLLRALLATRGPAPAARRPKHDLWEDNK